MEQFEIVFKTKKEAKENAERLNELSKTYFEYDLLINIRSENNFVYFESPESLTPDVYRLFERSEPKLYNNLFLKGCYALKLKFQAERNND